MEKPIFYDGSGKRWWYVKLVSAIVGLLVLTGAIWLAPQIMHPAALPPFPLTADAKVDENRPDDPSVPQLVDELNSTLTPVIGTGPLVRVVELTRSGSGISATEVYTHKQFGKLSPEDAASTGGAKYAIQRYGDTDGKRLALTFDDGPDPLYTPQLLDMLSAEGAHATFFLLGEHAARHPELVARINREGHTIANHTFTHVNVDQVNAYTGEVQINQTQRVLQAASNNASPYFRPPYGGSTDQSFRNSLAGILQSQKLGYVTASYDFDTSDWQFPSGTKPKYPALDGDDKVILLHDAGGERETTIQYVAELLKRGKEAGYTFASLDQIYGRTGKELMPVATTTADKASMTLTQAILVWPRTLLIGLFGLSLITLALTTGLNTLLAFRQMRRVKYAKRPRWYRPSVTVIVPCYNEGKVLDKTVSSLLESTYKHLQVLIVDDGSTDDTWVHASRLARQYDRVVAIRQKNGGKSSALNRAIKMTSSEIVICVDADTVFPPVTVSRLIRHFQNPKVGAVAGVVKVGNLEGAVTRWQALEYTIGIHIERSAQAFLGAIMIVPGACGAWRRTALLEAGCFSHATLAEDCDTTIKVQKAGYKVMQDNGAISYTEAPQQLRALVKQRFRWTFGTIQALWLHRNMILRRKYGWLGMLVMPTAIMTTIIPLIFWPALLFINGQNLLAGNYGVILLFFLASFSLQFMMAFIAIRLSGESLRWLWSVPFGRFVFGPIRTYIMYNTILTALRGAYVGWNKLARTGTVSTGQVKQQAKTDPVEAPDEPMPQAA